MLKSYPTVQEFYDNDFQRGFVEAMRQIVNIEKENKEYERSAERSLLYVVDHAESYLHRYEPGHDKPSNYF